MEYKAILARLNNMKMKDLKRACIIRGINFFYLMELDAMGMQDWLMHHWEDEITKSRIHTFDTWVEEHLELFGYVKEGEFPDHLKLAQVRVKKDYLPESMRESPDEILHYKPKKGTPKEKVFKFAQMGYSSKEIIASMQISDPDVSTGSIKVWASKARKQLKAKEDAKEK